MNVPIVLVMLSALTATAVAGEAGEPRHASESYTAVWVEPTMSPCVFDPREPDLCLRFRTTTPEAVFVIKEGETSLDLRVNDLAATIVHATPGVPEGRAGPRGWFAFEGGIGPSIVHPFCGHIQGAPIPPHAHFVRVMSAEPTEDCALAWTTGTIGATFR